MKRLLMTCAAVAGGANLLVAAAFAGPTFDDQGRIMIPQNMDRWPTVGTTYALQYEGDGGTTLNTVRLDPESYDAYVATGVFPVGAMLQLEVRLPIWDYSTLIRWIYDGVVRAPFAGYPGDFATTAPAASSRNGSAARTHELV